MPHNETINELLRGLIESQRQTNLTVEKLAINVNELVIADRERIIKDEHQREINDELLIKIGVVDDRINNIIKDNSPTWIKAKWWHNILDATFKTLLATAVIALATFFYKAK